MHVHSQTDHGAAHVHHPRHEPRVQHVVLDIGADIGALVVHTDRDLLGVEVEISPQTDDARRSHKQVLDRASGDRVTPVLVFDGLHAGAYTLWIEGEAVARGVEVCGGAVAELDWRSTAAG